MKRMNCDLVCGTIKPSRVCLHRVQPFDFLTFIKFSSYTHTAHRYHTATHSHTPTHTRTHTYCTPASFAADLILQHTMGQNEY